MPAKPIINCGQDRLTDESSFLEFELASGITNCNGKLLQGGIHHGSGLAGRARRQRSLCRQFRRQGQARHASRAAFRHPHTIGLIEDPAEHCSGPIWLRGGIAVVSADGFEYEVRNRMTLCRCGASKNKPFCDGAHASIKFDARKEAQPAS
jgi:CDGSH-type Zn-finger protein